MMSPTFRAISGKYELKGFSLSQHLNQYIEHMKTEIKKRDGIPVQQVAYINDLKVTTAGSYVAVNDSFGTAIGKLDTAIANIPAQTNYAVTCAETTPEGYAKTYTFTQCGQTIATVNIPKDMVVSSGQIVVDPAGQPAGTYIELTLANASSSKIYINVADLIDVYTTEQNATQVQLAIDGSNVISATIVAGSVGTTELAANAVTTAKILDANVTKAKLDASVQASLDLADTALQSHQDISGKADKDTDAVTGNLAEFDANHNPVDSGKKVSDFALDGHTHAISDITDLSTTLAGKVDVVQGKGLSTEDYTTAEKTKLDGIATGAQVNVIETVKVDGTALTPDGNKAVNIDLATPLSGKADKVANATSGNFAGLDQNGNLTDSGKKASDFALVSSLATVATSGNYGDLNNKPVTTPDDITLEVGTIDSSGIEYLKVKQNGIGADELQTSAVTTDKLNASAVTTAKINNGAVTTDKLATLTSFKLVDTANDGSAYVGQVYQITIDHGAIMVTPVA